MLTLEGHNLSVGDVVRITDWRGSKPDDRTVGTVIEFDTYHPRHERLFNNLTGRAEPMCCVLWSHGEMSWILCDRISRAFDIDECKSPSGCGIKDVGGRCG